MTSWPNLYGEEPTDADRAGVVTLRLDNPTASRLRAVIADMPGDDDSARVNALLDLAHYEPAYPTLGDDA